MAPLEPIFEFRYFETASSLERPLGYSTAVLEELAQGCDTGENYARYYMMIRRRPRLILVPERQLDVLHRRINALLFPVDLAMGEAAHGYIARRSVKTNAQPHSGARHLQKFDVRDFFANVSTSQITAALIEAGFGAESSGMLSRLVSCAGKLPLGARTSPRVSNIVLRDFDRYMSSVASARSLTYTRYADDLSFSSRDSSFDVSGIVERALEERGLELNARKSRSFKQGQPMFVTGLSVADEIPRLRKRFKARLRQSFYYVERFGLEGHAEHEAKYPRDSSGRIMGHFHYARSIEPEFASKLQASYPNAYRELIPQRADDRIERLRERRQEFVRRVRAAGGEGLPYYEPTASIGVGD